jgi:ChpA-C
MKMRTRVAGVCAATAAAVAMMGAPAFAQSAPISILSGNNVNVPVSAPVNVCGVAIPILGVANAGCHGGAASFTWISNRH